MWQLGASTGGPPRGSSPFRPAGPTSTPTPSPNDRAAASGGGGSSVPLGHTRDMLAVPRAPSRFSWGCTGYGCIGVLIPDSLGSPPGAVSAGLRMARRDAYGVVGPARNMLYRWAEQTGKAWGGCRGHGLALPVSWAFSVRHQYLLLRSCGGLWRPTLGFRVSLLVPQGAPHATLKKRGEPPAGGGGGATASAVVIRRV